MTSPTTTRNKEGGSGLVVGGEDAGLIFIRQKPPDPLLQCSMVTTVHPNLRGREQHLSQRSHPQDLGMSRQRTRCCLLPALAFYPGKSQEESYRHASNPLLGYQKWSFPIS